MMAGWTSGGFFNLFRCQLSRQAITHMTYCMQAPSYHPMRALRTVLLTGRPKAVNKAKLAGPADEDKAAEVTQRRNPGTFHRAIPVQLTFDFVGLKNPGLSFRAKAWPYCFRHAAHTCYNFFSQPLVSVDD